MSQLGKLEPVDIRKQWPDEARDFTPWLATEGLAYLNEALEMDLEVSTSETEVRVGSYRADIVATDGSPDSKVVIENQYKATDHDHIGKLLTYAATVGARSVVWIAETFRDEHRKAIEWLNENTVAGLDFYAIEMELWKIGESKCAPKLSVVVRPNVATDPAPPPGSKRTYLQFWAEFVEYVAAHNVPIAKHKPQPQHWHNVAIGRSGASLALTVRLSKKDIGCELYFDFEGATELFEALRAESEAVEKIVGASLDWQPLPGKKASRILLRAPIDANEEENWPAAFEWFAVTVPKFRAAFEKRVRAFKLQAPIDEHE